MVAIATFMATSTSVFAISGSSITNTADQITREKQQALVEEKLAEVCKRFTSSRLGSLTDEKRGEVEKKLEDKAGTLDEKRSGWDSSRDSARATADEKREEHYASLRAKATTDSQKQAVEDFVVAVEKAVNDRRAVQDAARETYRSAVDAALTEKKAAISSASLELTEAVDAAIAKAASSCENGTPVEQVRQALKADLEAARSNFKITRENSTDISSDIKTAVAARKAALETAKKDFETAVEKAKETLEAAFKS